MTSGMSTASPQRILVIDDEQAICWAFTQLLQPQGYAVSVASSAEEGLELAAKDSPDLVLCDVRLPGISGIDALPKLKELNPDLPVIVMTAHGTMETAIEATRRGAYNYLTKPIHNEDALHQIRTALERRNLSREVAQLRRELEGAYSIESLVGKAPAMQEVYKKIGAVAGSTSSVLITGESGSGKELVAKAIHSYSDRAKGPFIAVNCASMPEPLLESELYGHVKGAFTGAIRDKAGKAEVADGGTLFLDEIGEMPLSQQPALLRVLEYRRFTPVGEHQERECRARFVFATNRDLRAAVADGKFREDLFYRINVAVVNMPSLRQRPEDIPELTRHFLRRFAAEMNRVPLALSEKAAALLREYDWPGNIRELRNVIESAVMLAAPGQTEISEQDLPAEILAGRISGGLTSAECEQKRELLQALKDANGNQSEAARLLGCHRNTIRSRIRCFGIS